MSRSRSRARARDPGSTSTSRRSSRPAMRRLLLIIAGLLIFIAVAVPSAAVYYVVFTEDGLQFVLRRIPHRLGSVQLDIVNAKGTLAHGIRIERIDVEHERVHVRVEGLEGRVALLPLLVQTIRTRG